MYWVGKLKADRPLKSKGLYGNRGAFHKEPHGNIHTRVGDIWLLGRCKCFEYHGKIHALIFGKVRGKAHLRNAEESDKYVMDVQQNTMPRAAARHRRS